MAARVEDPLVGLVVAVVVLPVADLGRHGPTPAARVRDLLVDRVVAVVVVPVADLGRLRPARSAAVRHPLVDRVVAVVVHPVAHLRRLRPALTTRVRDPLVDRPIAIVVRLVTELRGDLAAHQAGVQHPLVDRPIAVVVHPVAGLVLRRPGLGPAHHRPHRRHTPPDALRETRPHTHRAVVPRPVQLLVQPAVAVVVDPVAALVHRLPRQRVAHHRPRLAVAHHRPVAQARPLPLEAAATHPRQVLVGRPVAVVVHPVADLRPRRRRPHARPEGVVRPTLALPRATHPDPDLVAIAVVTLHPRPRFALTRLAGPVVELAIAVVVHPVADLRPGQHLALAHLATTRPLPGSARPHARGPAWPRVARHRQLTLVRLPVAVVVARVAHLRLGAPRPRPADHRPRRRTHPLPVAPTRPQAHRARLPQPQHLVHPAVAVVVRVVAHLRHRRPRLRVALDRPPRLARAAHRLPLGDARPDPHPARLVQRQRLVGLPVAVVVHLVAGLRHRHDLALARPEPAAIRPTQLGPGDTRPLAGGPRRPAVTDLLGPRLAAGAAPGHLVGLAVTVVVRPVADLGARHHRPGARPEDARRAGPRPRRAHPDPHRPRRPHVTRDGDALVERPVAVVILSVAALGRRRHLVLARAPDTADTRHLTDATDAHPRGLLRHAFVAGQRELQAVGPLVDLAIAVVVRAVTDLGLGGAPPAIGRRVGQRRRQRVSTRHHPPVAERAVSSGVRARVGQHRSVLHAPVVGHDRPAATGVSAAAEIDLSGVLCDAHRRHADLAGVAVLGGLTIVPAQRRDAPTDDEAQREETLIHHSQGGYPTDQCRHKTHNIGGRFPLNARAEAPI